MTGFLTYIAGLILAGIFVTWRVGDIERREGGKAARWPAIWLTASLAAYTGFCLWRGFGWASLAFGSLAGVIVAVPAIPALWRHRG